MPHRALRPVAFKLIESNGRHIVFENKQHDFPQRIRYWLDASDVLHARIEGHVDGRTVAEEWAWRRVDPCASTRGAAAARLLTSGTAPP